MSKGVCLESLKVMIYITGCSLLLILFIQSLHRKIPTITIEDFYVPSLNQTGSSNTTATSIYFDLKFDNKNPVGIFYRPMNLTFSYFQNKTTKSSVPLGVYTLRGFHQPHHKEKHVQQMVMMDGKMVQDGGEKMIVMRLDLVGRVKFKSIAQWKRTIAVGVDVEVDEYTGEKVMKTGIKLVNSGGPPVGVVGLINHPVVMLLVFSSLFNLMLL